MKEFICVLKCIKWSIDFRDMALVLKWQKFCLFGFIISFVVVVVFFLKFKENIYHAVS